jgi:hypothetical protein
MDYSSTNFQCLHEISRDVNLSITTSQYFRAPQFDMDSSVTNPRYLEVPSQPDMNNLVTNPQYHRETSLDVDSSPAISHQLYESSFDMDYSSTNPQHLHETSHDVNSSITNPEYLKAPPQSDLNNSVTDLQYDRETSLEVNSSTTIPHQLHESSFDINANYPINNSNQAFISNQVDTQQISEEYLKIVGFEIGSGIFHKRYNK